MTKTNKPNHFIMFQTGFISHIIQAHTGFGGFSIYFFTPTYRGVYKSQYFSHKPKKFYCSSKTMFYLYVNIYNFVKYIKPQKL